MRLFFSSSFLGVPSFTWSTSVPSILKLICLAVLQYFTATREKQCLIWFLSQLVILRCLGYKMIETRFPNCIYQCVPFSSFCRLFRSCCDVFCFWCFVIAGWWGLLLFLCVVIFFMRVVSFIYFSGFLVRFTFELIG